MYIHHVIKAYHRFQDMDKKRKVFSLHQQSINHNLAKLGDCNSLTGSTLAGRFIPQEIS